MKGRIGSHERGCESLGSLKRVDFTGKLRDYQLLSQQYSATIREPTSI
jgi:hypothetical protein